MAKNYSYNELMKMQEEAINRVREMQKRATIATQVENKPTEPENQQKTLQPPNQNTQGQNNIKKETSPQHKSFNTNQNTKQANKPQQNQVCPYHKNNKNQNLNRQPYKKEQQKQDKSDKQNVVKVQKPSTEKAQNFNSSNPLFNLFGSNFCLGSLGNLFGGNFDISSIMGKLDDPEVGDQILIIGLLILLSSEGADKILLLALLYIMID